MQVKLLRVIQEKQVRRIGESQEKNVDVRIISATHKGLSQCIENGEFRQDLYYRLNVIELNMPALREMREDIPLIATTILGKLCRDALRPVGGTPRRVGEVMNYDYREMCANLKISWANVSAVRGSANRRSGAAVARHSQKIKLSTPDIPTAALPDPDSGLPLQDYLDQLEKDSIVKALNLSRYNRTKAAKTLGITVRSLRYRMERLGLNENA